MDDRACRAAGKRLADKGLAAVVWSVQCPKYVARLDRSAVALDAAEGDVGRVGERCETASGLSAVDRGAEIGERRKTASGFFSDTK